MHRRPPPTQLFAHLQVTCHASTFDRQLTFDAGVADRVVEVALTDRAGKGDIPN